LRSGGANACAGCATPAQVELTEVVLLSTTSGLNLIQLTTPTAPGSNVVQYTGSDHTPTRNRTWGAIKALYR